MKRHRSTINNRRDNAGLESKLELRRYFLRKYHADGPIRVLDCCQGSGVIWNELRTDFQLEYWGMDLKPKSGRLKLDSARYLVQSGWPENVIDIDTYGSPWKHWEAMLQNITQPVTVFLTIGQWMCGIDTYVWHVVGLGSLRKMIPPYFGIKLLNMYLPYVFEQARRHNLEVIEAVESFNTTASHARYVGVHIRPKQ